MLWPWRDRDGGDGDGDGDGVMFVVVVMFVILVVMAMVVIIVHLSRFCSKTFAEEQLVLIKQHLCFIFETMNHDNKVVKDDNDDELYVLPELLTCCESCKLNSISNAAGPGSSIVKYEMNIVKYEMTFNNYEITFENYEITFNNYEMTFENNEMTFVK